MAKQLGDIAGSYVDASSGRVVPARLSLHGGVLVLRSADDGSVLGELRRESAYVSEPFGHLARKLQVAGAGTFETDDSAGLDRLLTAPIDAVAPWFEKSAKRMALALLVAIGCLAAAWQWGVPVAARVAADRTPLALEDQLAQQSLQALDAAQLQKSKAPLARRAGLEVIFEELVVAYGELEDARPGIHFRLAFRNAPILGANAIALPGGPIVVTDQLLEELEEDFLVAAVLAHEIGHVHHRHSLESAYQAAGANGLLLLIQGQMTELSQQAANQGILLTSLSTSRRMEREADIIGVRLSLKTGRNPLDLIEALDRLTPECEECGQTSWFSTHPGLDDRAATIRRAMKDFRD